MRLPILLAVALALPAAPLCARTAPEMIPAGDPVRCINSRNIRQTRVVDSQTIDFVMTNSIIYRNSLPHNCPGLTFNNGIAYAPTSSNLCSVDTITVLQSAGGLQRGATCGLGPFQPVKPAEKAKEKAK